MVLSLLDTDTLSEVLKKRNAVVQLRAKEYLVEHQRFAISAMTRYEVLRGLKDIGATRRIQDFERFCDNVEIFPISDSVLDRAAALWVEARRGGHPRYDADLIIAATALVNDRVLATGNTNHFSWVQGLTIADWRRPAP